MILIDMKKLVNFIFLALFSFSAFAQKELGFGYGISQLFYQQNQSGTAVNAQTPYKGAYVSLTTKLADLFQDVTLRGGVMASYGVYKDDSEIDKEAYLTIPLDFRAVGKLGNTELFAGLGPRISYGLMSTVSSAGGGNVSVDVYKSADYKRFDIMFGFNFGVVLAQKYLLQLSWDRGLVTRMEDSTTKMTRNFLGIGAGILF